MLLSRKTGEDKVLADVSPVVLLEKDRVVCYVMVRYVISSSKKKKKKMDERFIKEFMRILLPETEGIGRKKKRQNMRIFIVGRTSGANLINCNQGL